MKLAIMQPTFIPWLGYFDLIDYVDEFVFLDTVQLSRRSWQVRNRLKVANKEYMFTLPIKKEKHRDNAILKDIKLCFDNYDFILKLKQLLFYNYKKAKHYENLNEKILEIVSYKTEYLCDYNIHFIKKISSLLDIKTKFIKASSLENIQGVKGELILDICIKRNCTEYISPIGSKDYLDKHIFLFKDRNIDVKYQYYNHPMYSQIGDTFIPYLGILDLLFNEGIKKTKEMILKGRTFRKAQIDIQAKDNFLIS